MKTALRIVALVLLTVLCVLLVWNIVELVKYSIYSFKRMEYFKCSYNFEEMKPLYKEFISPIFNIVYNFLLIVSAIYFMVKIFLRLLKGDITLYAKTMITTEALSAKIKEVEAKREEAKRLKTEKKIAKLQQKLNKIEESE